MEESAKLPCLSLVSQYCLVWNWTTQYANIWWTQYKYPFYLLYLLPRNMPQSKRSLFSKHLRLTSTIYYRFPRKPLMSGVICKKLSGGHHLKFSDAVNKDIWRSVHIIFILWVYRWKQRGISESCDPCCIYITGNLGSKMLHTFRSSSVELICKNYFSGHIMCWKTSKFLMFEIVIKIFIVKYTWQNKLTTYFLVSKCSVKY